MTEKSDLWPGDFYRLRETLLAEDQALLAELRAFLEARAAPEINTYWTRAEFPHHLVPEIAKLGIVGTSYRGYGFRGRSAVLDGFVALELARVDSSIATFVGVHGGCRQAPSTSAARRNRRPAGCRRWRAWRSSTPSA